MNAAALLTALCLGLLAGWVMRSELARAEARRQKAIAARADRARERAARRSAARTLRDRLSPDTWLLDALYAVRDEMRPGERAETLAIQARWKNTPDRVMVGIERGKTAADRAVVLTWTDGETCWDEPEDFDLPSPDSPEWVTGP